ncbi:MAG: choice-of-anchor J domain-containing protein [Ferruginibacter sp.]|nr:choice-of-anchor J domain-containing protein [Ferruginibacter sp.]
MKATFYTIFSVLIFVTLFSGCVNDEVAVPKLTCNQPDLAVNKTVAEVHATAGAIVSQYTYDDVIEAYVISTDEYGNFFKSISFQTLATATTPAIGFSVPVDATNTYVDYRLGNKVYVKLKDQYTDINYGSLRIGGIYVNTYNEGAVGRLSQNDYKNVLHASCTTITDDQLVRAISISDLLNDSNLNTLVELSDVQFAEAAVGRHYFEETNNIGGATNWSLVDKQGNQVIFRTSSYADFSSKLVPEGSGKVRGVLTKFGSDYQLVARSEKDIVMSGLRTIPFFSEDFKNVVDKSNLSLPGWANIVQSGTLFWKGTVYSGNGYAEFNISGTKVISNIAWLISPKIDMDTHTNEVLTFRTAQHHLDVDSPLNSLEVYVSTNFDGLNVKTATWIPVSVILPKQATPWYQFVGSGGVDLSSYTGKINIAFKYIGSGKNLALDGAFQIDDVQVFGD